MITLFNFGLMFILAAPAWTATYNFPTTGITFAGLSGLEPNETWTLYLGDDAGGDSGALLNTT